MKQTVKSIMMMVTTVFVVLLSSCHREDELGKTELSTTNNTKLMSKVSTNINGQTVYEVDPAIMSHFQHYCQLEYFDNNKKGKICGPVSYMMSAYPLARYKDGLNSSYGFGQTKLQSIINTTGVSTNLATLRNYANNHDGSFISATLNSTPHRDNAKDLIQNALSNNKFVIVAVNVFGTRDNRHRVNNHALFTNHFSNPDLQPTGTTNQTYMTDRFGSYQRTQSCRGNKLTVTQGVVGHIIVIVKVTINVDGTGIVEYIDPLADSQQPYGTSNRKYVSYTRLLNSIHKNGCSASYSILAIGLK